MLTFDRAIEEQTAKIARLRALKREIKLLANDTLRMEQGRGSKIPDIQFNVRASAAKREFAALGLGVLDGPVTSWIKLVE